MVLADTNIFIDFFRQQADSAEFGKLLENGEVLLHPFVEGELYLSHIPRAVKELLTFLPRAHVIDHQLLLDFAGKYGDKIHNVGYVDLHIYLSAAYEGARLLTRDAGLSELSRTLH